MGEAGSIIGFRTTTENGTNSRLETDFHLSQITSPFSFSYLQLFCEIACQLAERRWVSTAVEDHPCDGRPDWSSTGPVQPSGAGPSTRRPMPTLYYVNEVKPSGRLNASVISTVVCRTSAQDAAWQPDYFPCVPGLTGRKSLAYNSSRWGRRPGRPGAARRRREVGPAGRRAAKRTSWTGVDMLELRRPIVQSSSDTRAGV
jgi:hypothetical protein